MRVTVTTDEGEILEIFEGEKHGVSDEQIVSGRDPRVRREFASLVEEAVNREMATMRRRAGVEE